ncbi:hypothetical protein B0H13DRAFT_1904929 [Mycena leptocephala]|nr:hypothetical protein B0H13DRAFT_1904929 [Mycena leptocephala]
MFMNPAHHTPFISYKGINWQELAAVSKRRVASCDIVLVPGLTVGWLVVAGCMFFGGWWKSEKTSEITKHVTPHHFDLTLTLMNSLLEHTFPLNNSPSHISDYQFVQPQVKFSCTNL